MDNSQPRVGGFNTQDGPAFEFDEENIRRLKKRYLDEMKAVDKTSGGAEGANINPIKICMKLIFDASIERDPVKRNSLAVELSKFLTRSDGLINLFLALIDFDTSSQKVTTHNQRFMAVANIITCLPKLSIPYVDYCDSIMMQLQPLLIHPNTNYSSLASLIVKSMLDSPHAAKIQPVIRQTVLEPLLDPFRKSNSHLKLHQAILAIHNLIQNHVPPRLFTDIFPHLFYCQLTLRETPSQLKTFINFSLVSILKNLKSGVACCLLEQTLFHFDNIYTLVFNDDQILVEIVEDDKKILALAEFDTTAEMTLKLLEFCDYDQLVLEFFFHFQSKMWSSTDHEVSSKCTQLIEPLLEHTIDENAMDKLNLVASIVTNGQRSLELIARTLLNYIEFIRSNRFSDDLEGRNLILSALSQSLNILEVLSATVQTQDKSRLIQSKIVPSLREISLLIFIDDNQPEIKKLKQNIDSLLDRLTTNSHFSNQRFESTIGSESEREFNLILKDLNDPLVPVRVHALVSFKNSLLANDNYTVSRIPQLYFLVECSLADREPYVFLSAINLLAEMALRRTDDILGKLLKLYLDQDRDVQHTINVGEVLVRLVKRLNKMTPFYAEQIINTIMQRTKSDEELIRMSSLTNLGEICRSLGDSLGKYMPEVLFCIDRILSTDTIETKCAAIELLRTTLMGLDRRNVESVQVELKSIYNILKGLRYKTLDEKLCRQVDLALEEIGRLAKEIMMGSCDNDKLVKNVKLLQLLDP